MELPCTQASRQADVAFFISKSTGHSLGLARSLVFSLNLIYPLFEPYFSRPAATQPGQAIRPARFLLTDFTPVSSRNMILSTIQGMWASISCHRATAVALCLLILHSRQTLATSPAEEVTWLYPPQDGLTFYYQDTVNLTYESTVSLPYVGIYCRQGVGERMCS